MNQSGQDRAIAGSNSNLLHGSLAGRFLFTASAYKTFVLGQYLRDVEAGVRSHEEQLAIDDSVRMFGSPVFESSPVRLRRVGCWTP